MLSELSSVTITYTISFSLPQSDFPSKVIQNYNVLNHKLGTTEDKSNSDSRSDSLEQLHQLQIAPSISEPFISESKAAQQIMGGFSIVSMNMRDAGSGKLIWHSGDWTNMDMFEVEIKAEVPKCNYLSMMICNYLSMMICNFYTTHVDSILSSPLCMLTRYYHHFSAY